MRMIIPDIFRLEFLAAAGAPDSCGASDAQAFNDPARRRYEKKSFSRNA
jgi:hypothetical protein